MAALISAFMGMWAREQAKEVYKETLVTELGAFEGRLLEKLDERFTLAAGSRLTGREAEHRITNLEIGPRSRGATGV